MNVFVLNYDGKPLMPTKRGGRVRKLLDSGEAVVVKRMPFTIRLTREKKRYTQEISLGVKSGTRKLELSASTNKEELLSMKASLRTNIVDLLATKRELRQVKRFRLRFRKKRSKNRANARQKGWLSPSIKNKIQFHLKIIDLIHKVLPIYSIRVEICSFDIQKIKNPGISGKEYQEGPQKGFWNVREYILHRDNYICQHCKGKSGDTNLNVHHIESRKTGGNSPGNLITLCKTCHKDYHEGKFNLNIKRDRSFKDHSYMNIMKNELMRQISLRYINEFPLPMFGYTTKYERAKSGLISREIYSDSFIISGNLKSKPSDHVYICRQIRRHNRQIHAANILKGGKYKKNQSQYRLYGYRLNDIVEFNGRMYYIKGRRVRGYFDIRPLDERYNKYEPSYKKLKFKYVSNRLIIFKKC